MASIAYVATYKQEGKDLGAQHGYTGNTAMARFVAPFRPAAAAIAPSRPSKPPSGHDIPDLSLALCTARRQPRRVLSTLPSPAAIALPLRRHRSVTAAAALVPRQALVTPRHPRLVDCSVRGWTTAQTSPFRAAVARRHRSVTPAAALVPRQAPSRHDIPDLSLALSTALETPCRSAAAITLPSPSPPSLPSRRGPVVAPPPSSRAFVSRPVPPPTRRLL
ncbi:hypothetical protein QBC39DRAFT_386659 [Podospora conica]|nr:hypothetical protein QBC39DRAFT_386659 [Schizothecium conicum]